VVYGGISLLIKLFILSTVFLYRHSIFGSTVHSCLSIISFNINSFLFASDMNFIVVLLSISEDAITLLRSFINHGSSFSASIHGCQNLFQNGESGLFDSHNV
jgi:hypothetical protein